VCEADQEEAVGSAVLVAELAVQREALLPPKHCRLVVVGVDRQVGCSLEESRAHARPALVPGERGLHAAAALGEVASERPESPDRCGQPRAELLVRLQPIERGADVVVLGLQPVEPFTRRLAEMRLRILDESEEVLRVAAAQLLALGRVVEPLDRILANRLEHPEAFAGSPHETLLDERLERVEVGIGDCLDHVEGRAA
jgi:hypothetical protein